MRVRRGWWALAAGVALLLTVPAHGVQLPALLKPAAADAARVADWDADGLFAALAETSCVVLFATDWCALCADFQPHFQRLAQAFGGQQDRGGHRLRFGRVNTDQHGALAKTFGVHNVPFLTYLQHGAWYLRNDASDELHVLPAQRYEGYGAFSPAAEWLNNRTGLSVAVRAYVEELRSDEEFTAAAADPSADVLVEFYSPTCPHCKKLEGVYTEVGVRFADVAHVRIARIDATRHREGASRLGVKSLPSFVLFPRGHKDGGGFRFKGEGSARALAAFVRSPAAYLMEAQVTRRNASCVDDLQSAGLLDGPAGAGAAVEIDWSSNDRAANSLLHIAHGRATATPANRRRDAAADALRRVAAAAQVPRLRKTGAGSSPAMWNLLDNAKFNYERETLAAQGGAAAAELVGEEQTWEEWDREWDRWDQGAGADAAADAGGDPWEAFETAAEALAGRLRSCASGGADADVAYISNRSAGTCADG